MKRLPIRLLLSIAMVVGIALGHGAAHARSPRPPSIYIQGFNGTRVIGSDDGKPRVTIGSFSPGWDLPTDRSSIYFSTYRERCRYRLSRFDLGLLPRKPHKIAPGAGYHPAVSPDGRFVATANKCGWSEPIFIEILDLRNGEVTRFRAPGDVWCNPEVDSFHGCTGPTDIGMMSWAPDSRHLAYDIWIGDVSGHGGAAYSEVWVLHLDRPEPEAVQLIPPVAGARWSVPAYRGRWGSLAVAERCCVADPFDYAAEAYTSARVLSVDPYTSEVLSPLVHLPAIGAQSLDFDASGRHMIYVTDRSYYCGGLQAKKCRGEADRLYRWSGRTPVYLGRAYSARW